MAGGQCVQGLKEVAKSGNEQVFVDQEKNPQQPYRVGQVFFGDSIATVRNESP